jgi:hypothetical protein
MFSIRRLSSMAAVAIATAAGLPLAAASAASPAADGAAAGTSCAKQFSHAVHRYIRTTDERNAPGFERLLDADYTTILPGGTVIAGKDAGSAFINRFFARTDWSQTFAETRRAVEGCRTALVVFDSTYTDEDGAVPLVIALSWTYHRGHWLVLQDQNTVVS